MGDLNVFAFTGRLTADPDLKYTSSGLAICKFACAINEGYAEKRKTHFVHCTAFKKQAENINTYLHKGSLVSIRGRIEQNIWTDDNGKDHSRIDVVADSVNFLDPKPKKDTLSRDGTPDNLDKAIKHQRGNDSEDL